VVHAGGPGGVDYELNWRVDRIREGDLVLVREDPAHADVPPATRVIALRTAENEEKQ
jgi:type IV pilus assembly protein PilP